VVVMVVVVVTGVAAVVTGAAAAMAVGITSPCSTSGTALKSAAPMSKSSGMMRSARS
jgi:hypothetical protein